MQRGSKKNVTGAEEERMNERMESSGGKVEDKQSVTGQ